MNNSGTYKMINGKLTKISDRIPSLNGVFDIHFNEPYYSQTLGCVVHSKQEKQALMRQQNLIETIPGERLTTPQPKPSPEKRKREIEERINRHLTDRGVEGIKLKDLHKQRKEKSWENRTQAEIRETAGFHLPEVE